MTAMPHMQSLTVYLLLLLPLLTLLELLYVSIARRLHIGASVCERSSSTHRSFTTTGGGVVFILAALLLWLWSAITGAPLPPGYRLMTSGALVLAILSFTDDVHDLRPLPRLAVQTVVMVATYIIIFQQLDYFLLLIILGVGFINAYNFMDGISGMLTGYTIVALVTLLWMFTMVVPGVRGMVPFILTLLTATLIFGIFNFLPRHPVFCGDVGSITMGFFIVYLMVILVLATHNVAWIFFFIVYAIDTVFTIFYRLFRGENILASHRSHLYQVVANGCGTPHWQISLIYSGLQLAINAGLILIPASWQWVYIITLTPLLITAYFMVRSRASHP